MNTTATEAKMIKRMVSKGHNADRAKEIIQEGYTMSFNAMLHHLRYWDAISQYTYEKWYDLAQELSA